MAHLQVAPREAAPWEFADDGSDDPVLMLDGAMLAGDFLLLRSSVAALLQSGGRRLIVDISRLDRLSSSTVSALLWAQRRCRIGGGAVTLRGPSRSACRMLSRTGLRHVFDVEPARAGWSGRRSG